MSGKHEMSQEEVDRLNRSRFLALKAMYEAEANADIPPVILPDSVVHELDEFNRRTK